MNILVMVMTEYEYCSEKQHAFRFLSLLLQGSILRKYSAEMSGTVGEFDHDWRVAILNTRTTRCHHISARQVHWLSVVYRIQFKLALVISQSIQTAAQITSPILCRRATVIRHGLVSARRPALTILFHGQERNLATEPSLWPA